MPRRRFRRTHAPRHPVLRRRKRRGIFSLLARFFLAGILSLFLVLAGLFVYFAKDLPSPENISSRRITQSTKIYDRSGTVLLYDIHGEEKRTVVPLSDIPRSLQLATIAIEDHTFYQHHGIYLRGIIRAFFANLVGRRIAQGGSTITQQYVKNSFLTPKRTFRRKVKEAILAVELELKYSKGDILEFYLNEVPYGSNAYGIEAASQTFFGKPARKLTLAESATLAALPQAPSFYSPYGNHPEKLAERRRFILQRMRELGFISEEEMQSAREQKLAFSRSPQRILAPHFVMMVREFLDGMFGEDYIERSGLKVYTALDMRLQRLAEQTVTSQLSVISPSYRAGNAALAAIDPRTGDILALVGSRDYFDIEHDGNVNVALRPRQPGSSFKPFAYARAFQLGYTTRTVLFDLSTEFAVAPGSRPYRPQNYDHAFRGPVSLRQALAQSLNIPAVKVLYLTGIDKTIDLAHTLGITTLSAPNRYGLALVLGGGEVKLLDMASAYGVFAADGIRRPVRAIIRIEDADGNVIFRGPEEEKRVLEPGIARLINDVLSDNTARSAVFGARSALFIPGRHVAAKTGTTENFRDAWTLGYSPSLVTGVWVGNNDNTLMRQAPGALVAAPIWNAFMTAALADLPDESFPPPPDITLPEKPMLNGEFVAAERVKIDTVSGKRATEFTPPEFTEEKTYATAHTILHFVRRDDPLGDPPRNPKTDPQYRNWEDAVREWRMDPKRKKEGLLFEAPPEGFDTIHVPENAPRITILSPTETSLPADSTIALSVDAEGIIGSIAQVDFFLDSTLVGTRSRKPYSLFIHLPPEISAGERHIFRVRAYDEFGNVGEKEHPVYFAIPES